MNSFFHFIISLFFPNKCLLCQQFGEILCLDCQQKILLAKKSFYLTSELEIEHLDGLIVIFDPHSNEDLKKIIYAYKYNFITKINLFFGKNIQEILNGFVSVKIDLTNSIFVPIPLASQRQKYRGFNQSELLTKQITTLNPLLSSDNNFLIRIKETNQQAKLHRTARQKNLQNAFKLTASASLEAKKNIILVDDVFTSGATMKEATKTIKQKFPNNKVYGLVLIKSV